MTSELIAYCGLYCGACSFRMAAEENDRNHILNMPACYDGLKNNLLEWCPGCRLENKCGECAIRDCAEIKKIDYCGLCSSFPCEKIISFANDGKPHHSEIINNFKLLLEIGEKQWLEVMKQSWTCSKCGTKKSWYYNKCECNSNIGKKQLGL